MATELTATQQGQVGEMQAAMDRSAAFQQQMTMMQMENATTMAAYQAMKGAFDKIRA